VVLDCKLAVKADAESEVMTAGGFKSNVPRMVVSTATEPPPQPASTKAALSAAGAYFHVFMCLDSL
jgi:hypothetical protein